MTTLPVIQWDGLPISKPGIYAGIHLDAYHGDLCVGPSISSSGLRDIFHSGPRAYYRGSYLNPKRKPKKISQAFLFGRAAHHLLLGETGFRSTFAIRPETYPDLKPSAWSYGVWREIMSVWDTAPSKPWNGNSTICKVWMFWAWWQRKLVVTQSEIEMIRAMAESLAEEPLIQQGILSGLIEHSFVWQDEETGMWLKWRPDAIPTDSLNFSDLKTTTSVDDEALDRAITEYGYNQQGALGAMACNTVLGRDMDDFSLVFVEKEDLFPCVRVKTIRPADITLGVEQNRVALRTFARCVETGRWPGPGGEQRDAEFGGLTPWAYEKIERRIKDMKGQLDG